MNFGDLKSAVLTNLIDTPTAVQDAVPGLVTAAHKTLQRRHDFFVMKARKDATTVANTRILCPVPTDWKRPRARPYYSPQYCGANDILWGLEQEVVRRYNATDTGSPALLTDDGTNINLWPLSDSTSDWGDGEYRISVPYFKILPAPVNDGDEDWFLANCAEFIEYKATSDGFMKDWDEQRSAVWDGRAEKKYAEILKADKERWLGALDTFAPQLGARGPRLSL